MERVVHIAKSFAEAEQWDIRQNISMTPDERLAAARQLAERVYGKNQPDVRAAQSIVSTTAIFP
ncbi:MAG: hypothetical protein KAW12_24225 [Candidatus Aminicenantes bacterium]|nr:hypothetical protein [Candidatus Aminicenantes bacterium]